MFSIIGDAANFAVKTAVNSVTAPVRMAGHAIDIIDGLTELELRDRAIYALGEEVVVNMTQSEILDWYTDNR